MRLIDFGFFANINFFRESQFIVFVPDDTLYHQTKTPISFWYRRGLNFKYLIQLSEAIN